MWFFGRVEEGRGDLDHGCALATTVAVHLARGEDMEQAASTAVRIVARCLEATTPGTNGELVPLNLI